MSIFPVRTPTGRARVGLAAGDITPPGDIYHRLWGAAKHDRAAGVHRPLRASVLAIEPAHPTERTPEFGTTSTEGRNESAEPRFLIALDLCLFRPPEMEEIRSATARLADVAPNRLVFTFSHTHSSGNFSRDRAALPGGERIGPYLDALPRTLALLIDEAKRSLAPATLTAGTAVCAMGHNRDLADVACGRFLCGFNPAEPPGLPLTVVRVSDADGRPRAVVVNYPCHPTTLAWDNVRISPDYIGALRETIEAATGAPCLFLLAPCGDVGPRVGFVGNPAVADRNGRQVGFAALSALEALPADRTDYHFAGAVFSGATLGQWEFRPHDAARRRQTERCEFRRFVVRLPYLPNLPAVSRVEADLTDTLNAEAAAKAHGDATEEVRLRALAERHRRLLERIRPLPADEQYPLEVDLWRVGDTAWVAVEGEPYHALQNELASRFPRVAFVFSVLSNGARPSYLPERHDYGKSLYQVEIALLAPGSLERLTDAIAAEVKSLLRDVVDDA